MDKKLPILFQKILNILEYFVSRLESVPCAFIDQAKKKFECDSLGVVRRPEWIFSLHCGACNVVKTTMWSKLYTLQAIGNTTRQRYQLLAHCQPCGSKKPRNNQDTSYETVEIQMSAEAGHFPDSSCFTVHHAMSSAIFPPSWHTHWTAKKQITEVWSYFTNEIV